MEKNILKNNIAIILVEPQLGENIGTTARAMLNFGLSDLRIVSPRDGWPNEHALVVASGAGVILENAKLFNSTKDACANLNYIFATTARHRDLVKENFSPKIAMKNGNGIIKNGLRVGILFGPERAGLTNEDISLAQAIISVPINPKFSSLNLAQCVVLLAYEWFNAEQLTELKQEFKLTTKYAPLIEVENLKLALFKNLSSTSYFWPEAKKASLMENLNNLFGRLALTSADVRTLHGVIKALSKRYIKE